MEVHLKFRSVRRPKQERKTLLGGIGMVLECRELLLLPVRGELRGDAPKEFRKLGRVCEQVLNRGAVGMRSRDLHIARLTELQLHARGRIQMVIRQQSIDSRGEIP